MEDCEARRDCSVKRRDDILSEKNEQNVSAIGNGAREWRGRFAMKKRVDCSPEVSRVGRAGVNSVWQQCRDVNKALTPKDQDLAPRTRNIMSLRSP